MRVELVKKNEYELMIKCANEWFSFQHEKSFDFLKIHPKLYKKTADYYLYTYFLKTDENDLVGLFSAYPISYDDLNLLCIGTVTINPKYRNQGCLKFMFDYIDKFLSINYDFTFLLGENVRYQRYGFYKTGLKKRYSILKKNLPSNDKIKLELAKPKDNDILYDFYQESNNKVIRRKDLFYDTVTARNTEAYLVYSKDLLVGYLLYNNERQQVFEIMISDDLFYGALLEISNLKDHQISLSIELDFDSHQNQLLKRVYDNVMIIGVANLKINDFVGTLNKMVKNKKTTLKGSIIFSIEDTNYEFLVEDQITIKKTNKKGTIISLFEFYEILFSFGINDKKYDNPLLKELFPIIIPGSLSTIDKI
ncbi:hypothetical protein LJC17_00490 [Acholeplasma sp. OttesenSCG-928-E16]|nr:hypothetical protein [Acholeplasma sp. OttesenSCG-928-E16]